jgi:hypothetical protein
MLRQDDYVRAKLVEMGWRWSSAYTGGHLAGQMVMHAIANRVRAGHGTWLQVMDNLPKYMAENEMPPLVHGSIWSPEFVKLLHAVEGIHDGSAQDMTKGAFYWGDLSYIERPWFKQMMDATNELGLRQHPLVANLNSLSFFR